MLSATAIPRVETPTLARIPASVIVAKRAPSTAADHTRQRSGASAYQSQFCASHGPSALSQRPTVVHSASASSSVRPLSAADQLGLEPRPERERLQLRRERRMPARGALEHARAEAPHVVEPVPEARRTAAGTRPGRAQRARPARTRRRGPAPADPSRPCSASQRRLGERGHAGRVVKSLSAKWHSRRVSFGRCPDARRRTSLGSRNACRHLAHDHARRTAARVPDHRQSGWARRAVPHGHARRDDRFQ